MRVVGKENQVFLWMLGIPLTVAGWISGFTTFEWCMGIAAAYALYLLICVTDYLHLIGESLESTKDR